MTLLYTKKGVLADPQARFTSGGAVSLHVPGQKGIFLPNQVGRKGKPLFDFADTVNWTQVYGPVTLASSPIKQYGANGLAFTPTSASDGVKKLFGSNTFAVQSGALMALIVYIPPAAVTGGNTMQLKFSSDANATKSLSYTITNAYLKNPGWQILYFRAGEDGTQEYQAGGVWTAVGGEAWGNNFNFFQIICNGFAAQTLVFDSLLVGARDIPRVVMTFDNISPSLMTVIAPSLAAYGWSAGLMMDGDAGTVATNLANARILIDKFGWDVGTQGILHGDYQANGRDITADFNTAKGNFIAAGLPAPTTFAYPLNSSGKTTDSALAALGVTWRRGNCVDIQPNLGFGIPGADDGMVRSGFSQHLGLNYNQGTAYSQLVNRRARHIAQGGLLSLFTHKETALSTDWGLGGDLTQWYMLLDQLAADQFQYGTHVIKPTEVKNVLQSSVFV